MSRTVTAIPATKKLRSATASSGAPARRRVAAYARVSTEMEEQTSSYEAQIDYYTTYIHSRNDWQFAGDARRYLVPVGRYRVPTGADIGYRG
ncbi:hypothetical protein ACP6M7_13340 [Corynebacterium striatum]|uniref:hypothetical protein n=1 Tax=Corynebacterium striatum TaxID=43770 RepID=UPI003F80961B